MMNTTLLTNPLSISAFLKSLVGVRIAKKLSNVSLACLAKFSLLLTDTFDASLVDQYIIEALGENWDNNLYTVPFWCNLFDTSKANWYILVQNIEQQWNLITVANPFYIDENT